MADRLRIVNGRVYDPINGVDGAVREICIEDGKVVASVPAEARRIDAEGMVVMPGGVDIHCHIAGPKVNLARKVQPEDHRHDVHPRTAVTRSGTGGTRLMTMRSEGQFNTVVYEEEDIYRGQERRDVILMNAADIKSRGLHVDDRVTVTSTSGSLSGLLVRSYDIPAGNAAMYFPEANAIVPRVADAKSHTPAFKNTVVMVAKES